jgi:uncharacterized iron-regulated membrane protein
MANTRKKNRSRYRTMRSAILTGSFLSFLPLLVLMKSTAGSGANIGPAASQVQLATVAQVAAAPSSNQAIANVATADQTANTQNTASAAATPTSTASNTQTSSSASTSSMTYTRTKAS